MKNYKCIYSVFISVLIFIGFVRFSYGAQDLKKKKIAITPLKYVSEKNKQRWAFFKKSLARSIRTSLDEKFIVVFNEKKLSNNELIKKGFTHKITGSYNVINNNIKISFSVIHLKKNMPIIVAKVSGYPDTRVFDLVDKISAQVAMAVNRPVLNVTEMTRLIEIDKQGKITKGTVDLSNANLRGRDFEGRNLSGKNISNSDLTKADLEDTNLSNTNLSGSKLIDTDMENAKLFKTDLTNAILKHAFLEDARFNKAKLNNADLSYAKLIAVLIKYSSMENVKIYNATFADSSIYKTNLSGASIKKTHFDSAWLKYVNFKNAKIIQSGFSGATLINVDFSSVNLTNTTFSGAELSKVKFDGADLTGVYFGGTGLKRTDPMFKNAKNVDKALFDKKRFYLGLVLDLNITSGNDASVINGEANSTVAPAFSVAGAYFFSDLMGIKFNAGIMNSVYKSEFGSNTYEYTRNALYLELDYALRVKRFWFCAGIYFGYVFDGKGETPSDSDKAEGVNSGLFGLNLNITYVARVSRVLSWYLAIGFKKELTKAVSDDYLTKYNLKDGNYEKITIYFSLGFLIGVLE